MICNNSRIRWFDASTGEFHKDDVGSLFSHFISTRKIVKPGDGSNFLTGYVEIPKNEHILVQDMFGYTSLEAIYQFQPEGYMDWVEVSWPGRSVIMCADERIPYTKLIGWDLYAAGVRLYTGVMEYPHIAVDPKSAVSVQLHTRFVPYDGNDPTFVRPTEVTLDRTDRRSDSTWTQYRLVTKSGTCTVEGITVDASPVDIALHE